MNLSRLGVCYYPEHWPTRSWRDHAAAMRDMGIEQVRIGEFAWSRIEPARGVFQWEWLDQAVATLAESGLGIVMCTPTACPPKWLVDELPQILPSDEHGHPRRFGSRRHYRFASRSYRIEAARICDAVVERYGKHPAVIGWQTDNEYGCHDSTLSFAEDDCVAFRQWLQTQYGDIDTLNRAWGTVFWSQEYRDFGEIELPVACVTEANPSHRLAYWRFAAGEVETFNRDQVQRIRSGGAPEQWVSHNFMGNFIDFDHFAVGRDLDVAAWDSYPLGFLDMGWFSQEEKLTYRRTGHPDWAAFHHDLYWAVGNGRFGVMEQQPGMVNWAAHNAQPLPGMVRFWAWEAIAHGAEFVSFFRWQQAPFAQEQMHAGLRLPDGSPAPAAAEVTQLAQELRVVPAQQRVKSKVALVFDYPSAWAVQIQPQCAGYSALHTCFNAYSALRQLGLDVDIVSQAEALEDYSLVVIPSAVILSSELVRQLERTDAPVVIGPRVGSKTNELTVPDALPPDGLQALLPLRVIAVDAMRPGASRQFGENELSLTVHQWHETVETQLPAQCFASDGAGLWYRQGQYHYLNGWLDVASWTALLRLVCGEASISVHTLSGGLRLRRRGSLTFAFNVGPDSVEYQEEGARYLVGGSTLTCGELAIWMTDDG